MLLDLYHNFFWIRVLRHQVQLKQLQITIIQLSEDYYQITVDYIPIFFGRTQLGTYLA
jgi:hypothetical protein